MPSVISKPFLLLLIFACLCLDGYADTKMKPKVAVPVNEVKQKTSSTTSPDSPNGAAAAAADTSNDFSDNAFTVKECGKPLGLEVNGGIRNHFGARQIPLEPIVTKNGKETVKWMPGSVLHVDYGDIFTTTAYDIDCQNRWAVLTFYPQQWFIDSWHPMVAAYHRGLSHKNLEKRYAGEIAQHDVIAEDERDWLVARNQLTSAHQGTAILAVQNIRQCAQDVFQAMKYLIDQKVSFQNEHDETVLVSGEPESHQNCRLFPKAGAENPMGERALEYQKQVIGFHLDLLSGRITSRQPQPNSREYEAYNLVKGLLAKPSDPDYLSFNQAMSQLLTKPLVKPAKKQVPSKSV